MILCQSMALRCEKRGANGNAKNMARCIWATSGLAKTTSQEQLHGNTHLKATFSCPSPMHSALLRSSLEYGCVYVCAASFPKRCADAETRKWKWCRESAGTKRDKLKGTNARNSLIFADFCCFSLFLGITAFWRRRFSQKTAGNRRFSQKTADFCRNPFVPF